MTKIYYIRTEGNEDNGFQPIICGYGYRQYKEVIQQLKQDGKSYTTWVETV